jgi:hypothetical protein
VDWIHLAQDRIQWWALVKAVMNNLGSTKGREFLDQLNEFQLIKKDLLHGVSLFVDDVSYMR